MRLDFSQIYKYRSTLCIFIPCFQSIPVFNISYSNENYMFSYIVLHNSHTKAINLNRQKFKKRLSKSITHVSFTSVADVLIITRSILGSERKKLL